MSPPKLNPTTTAGWLSEVFRLLTYDEKTGHFTWTQDRYRPVAGEIAGTVKPNGYRVIVVAGRICRAHRLAWLFVHGDLPPRHMDIDHINGVRDDNRISNLRIATRGENLANARSKSATSKYRGIGFDRERQKWLMQVKGPTGKRIVKRYPTEIEAARAYDSAATELWGSFARLNFPTNAQES